MADSYRRCGCRRPDNTLFPGLPDEATAEQRAATCPALLRDSRHGSWGFAVSAGKDPRSGKRLQVRRMGYATKREAQRERAKIVEQVASGRYRSDPKLTVAAWFPAWLDRRERDGLRPSTARMYRRYIEQDVVPALGNLKLADLRRHHVDRFVQDMSKAGRGATTVRRIHAVVSSGLSAAERLDLVTYNAASKIALPPVNRERTKVWEPEQVRAFLDVAAEHRLGPLYELAVLTGLRRGRWAGLRWSDVDMSRRELLVRQQRVDVGNRVVEGPVKTAAGQDRRVSLGGEAIAALVEWKQRQADERQLWDNKWVDTGYVFTRENGEPLRPDGISALFDRLVTKAGLPHMSVHGLRHQHASLLLAGGVNIAIVSKRLGHSTYPITSDLYSHLLGSTNLEAAEAGEAVLPPRGRGGLARTSAKPKAGG